jgi:hypothetical protein
VNLNFFRHWQRGGSTGKEGSIIKRSGRKRGKKAELEDLSGLLKRVRKIKARKHRFYEKIKRR